MQKTLENLTKAFIGESQARNRYTFYASTAQKEGYEQIAEIFRLTADNEKEHAKRLFEHIQELKGDLRELEVMAKSPLTLGNTTENLKAAIAGEHWEYSEMYPEFAKVAAEENLQEISDRLLSIAHAEIHHEERYIKILEEVEAGTIFQKEEEMEWLCRECGYIHRGKTPPDKCPACNHEKNFYQLKCEVY